MPRLLAPRLLLVVTCVVVRLGMASPAASQSHGASSFKAQCASFRPAQIPGGAKLDSVRFHSDSADWPARCVVRARIVSSPTSTIKFRIDLPDPSRWNGKTLMMGGGGFDGAIQTELFDWRRLAIQLGMTREETSAFVVGATDSGHQGRGDVPYLDYSWAAHNPTGLLNHASEANHLVLGAMVALAKAFYGKAPVRRYMFGLSNGGRQGLIAAQRHPEDYDGIMALAPAISQTAFAANLTPIMRHIYSRPDNWLDQKKVALYGAAELAACDELDGLKDGIIGDYRGCHFDPATLVCKGADDESCLTRGQVESLRMWMGEKHVAAPMADGLGGYAIYGPGGPSTEWTYLFGSTFGGREAFDFIAADNIVKNGITDDPVASVMTHDPEKWPQRYLENSQLIDATNPDLSRFAARGGKILSVQGAGDYCVSYERTGQYYRSVQAKMGADRTRAFFRYYVAPSLGHGLNGAGADSFTLFAALEDWVERGKSPDDPIATKQGQGGTATFARPLCEYGKFPKYRGTGDPNQAASFACTAY
jgi:pimeloyl-ACP methyl ester carboxylesterase